MKRRFPLHIHISTLFLILLLLVGGVIGGLGYSISRDILKSTANTLSERIGRETLREFTNLLGPAEMAARLLSLDGVTQAGSLEQRLENIGFMREALNNSPELTSVYVGYGNGDFFQLRRLWNEADRLRFEAPEATAYIVQSIDRAGGAARGRYLFLDAALATLRSDDRPDYPGGYDPRSRSWYKAAMAASGQIKTPPYLFYTTQQVGTTIANRAKKGDAVVGADIRLETLDQTLVQQKATPGTHLLVVNRAGDILTHSDAVKAISRGESAALATLADLDAPILQQLAPVVLRASETAMQTLIQKADGDVWHVTISPFKLEGAKPLFMISAIPDRELMAASYVLMRQLFIAMILVILLAIPATWMMARAISEPLRKLAGEAEAIRRFEFSQAITVESPVLEVANLALTMDSMKRTIRRFLDISLAVAAENNFDRLLPHLFTETLSAADADAGVLYLTDNEQFLPATGLKSDGSALPPSAPVLDPVSGSPLLNAAVLARTPCSARLTPADIDALGLADAVKACGASHAIAVPLLNREQVLVGAMILLSQRETDEVRLSFIGALSGSAAVSLEAKALIRAQKLLFEAMIQLIAGAIDAKSAYTGGHCARVPELTKMLARAACAQTSGSYKDFSLSEDDWEAVHVAAWLHDCGKVTTPEYVVDKATKLETLYDRIHEIRMRFEVLKRDAEIVSLKTIIDGESKDRAKVKLAAEWAQLDDDFAFIAQCNEGGEFMAPDRQERLKLIAARTWQRTLDDRIGISHEEKERKARTPPTDLPALERLLADKPEHVIERQARDRIAEDNPWGFKMRVPERLYNRGELYNLSVARGTLSEEERYKINEHIVQTLIMLSQLPFPKHLRQVPEIAAGHHEKMDGSGYPKRLRGDEMSPLARMMAVADIFEALTAVDRPYKKGKTLSEAIKIMAAMKKDQHIDPELFNLFLRSGVYKEYADRFMRPEQIDAVDIEAFIEPLTERGTLWMGDAFTLARVRMEALDPAYAVAASQWAERLQLRLGVEAEFALQLGSEGLQFVELGAQAAGPIRVDFLAGPVAHRAQFGGGSGQMIAKAVGISPGIRPTVLDATAGLGRDAFVLASLGCTLTLIERQPLIAALLEDGLQRALADAQVATIVARMSLRCGDAIALMGACLNDPGDAPQVIYLDPMFPHRDKAALVKKEMRLFRPLAGDDDDAPALLEAALALATHRVVVKRPRKAPAISGLEPAYVLEGKSSRFDIYPKKSLKVKGG